MKVFIIHGSFGNPKENWIPWLQTQLQNLGHQVFVPEFPIEDYVSFSSQIQRNPQTRATKQNLNNWLKAFEPYFDEITSDTIFVAHSLGPAFVLRLLETINIRIRSSIFVSGFLGRIGIPQFDAVNSTFIDNPFDWARIKRNCQEFYVVSSDNDPYVPFSFTEDVKNRLSNYTSQEGKILANYLNVNFQIIKGGQHLNEEAGYKTFLYIFTLINKITLSGGKNPVIV